MTERLEKLRDSLPSETVIGTYLARGRNPYKGGEEDCLIAVLNPGSTYLEQGEAIEKIHQQGFSIDDFYELLVIFEG